MEHLSANHNVLSRRAAVSCPGSAQIAFRRLRWKYHWYRKDVDIGYPPFFINVEPTNACNLACRICALDGSRAKGVMEWPLFENIIEQAARAGVTEIRLFLAGEPLLHKNIGAMISHVGERGMISCVHTNAALLSEGRAIELIRSGLDIISFSFHGDTPEAYERVHVGARFDEALRNILRFLEIKRELNSVKPYSILQMAKRSQNGAPAAILRDFKRRFEGLPLDQFRLISPHTWAGQKTDFPHDPRGTYYFPCHSPWQSVSIAWDGRVLGCCGDLNGVMPLADIREQSLSDIWLIGPILSMRRKLGSGQVDGLPLCRQCDAVWRKAHPLLGDLKSTFLC
ncbi:MAG: radical SAM protein [Candidatus Lindowbacteria bacterium]|nr:radical SAM protein [Candidatus Lindowbacteria bacterium]